MNLFISIQFSLHIWNSNIFNDFCWRIQPCCKAAIFATLKKASFIFQKTTQQFLRRRGNNFKDIIFILKYINPNWNKPVACCKHFNNSHVGQSLRKYSKECVQATAPSIALYIKIKRKETKYKGTKNQKRELGQYLFKMK